MEKPYVAIVLPTYNHEKYIAQAIEGVLMQKTNFPYQIIIGEDCSTDSTRAICAAYADQYKDRIRLICTKQNNLLENTKNVWKASSESGAKYIAFCEGDDYWTDPNKLQKHADFLDANEDFSMCFTAVEVRDEIGLKNFRTYLPKEPKDVFTIEDIIKTYSDCFISTVTIFFRNILPNPLPDFYFNAAGGDLVLHLLLTNKGKAKFFPDKTAVYRVHSGGITKSQEFILRGERKVFDLFDKFNEYTDFKYHAYIKKVLFPQSKLLLMYGSGLLKGKERRDHIFRMLRGYNRYRDGINLKEIIYYNLVLFLPFTIKIFKLAASKNKK